MTILLRVVVAVVCALEIFGGAALMAQKTDAIAIVPVFVADKHSNGPAMGLRASDFEVLAERTNLKIVSVESGSGVRPLAVWFVMQCPEEGIAYSWVSYGSGFMRGKTAAFTPVLEKLWVHDTVGVAHWCDDGTFGIDLTPTADRAAPSAALEKLLNGPQKKVSNQPGQNSLHDVFIRVREAAGQATPGALPVIIFLYGDHSGMYHEQANEMLNQPGALPVVYGINNGAVTVQSAPVTSTYSQMYVVHFLSAKTGGEVRSSFRGNYADELEKIVRELQGRYELKVELPAGTNAHEINVKLTSEEVRKNVKASEMRFPPMMPNAVAPAAPAGADTSATLLAALEGGATKTDVAFDASCKKSAETEAQCRLYIDPGKLSWSAAEGDVRHSELMLVTAEVSAQGGVVWNQTKRFQVAQKADEKKAVILSVNVPIAEGATKLQFALKDMASGKMGTFGVGVGDMKMVAAGKNP